MKLDKIMPLLCKECNGRRLPIAFPGERDALWLCEKCKNFTNITDEFVRDWSEKEIEEFRKDIEQRLENVSKLPDPMTAMNYYQGALRTLEWVITGQDI